MSQDSNESVVSTLMGGGASAPSGAMKLARMIAIAVPVVGAAPTAYNVYQSYQHGIPYGEVSYRLAQHDLWVKNFDCKIDYKALTTAHGTRVDVGACTKTGDISIKVTAPGGQASYEWLAFDRLRLPTKTASLMDWVVSPAEAEEAPRAGPSAVSSAGASSAAPFRVAQAAMEVVCQTMQDKSRIIRIVREAGKCYREYFSPFQGRVDRREEVPCTTTCTPGK